MVLSSSEVSFVVWIFSGRGWCVFRVVRAVCGGAVVKWFCVCFSGFVVRVYGVFSLFYYFFKFVYIYSFSFENLSVYRFFFMF